MVRSFYPGMILDIDNRKFLVKDVQELPSAITVIMELYTQDV